jgi:hypothetical protein
MISYLTTLALVCIAAGLWFFALHPSGSVARLPDGTELHLLGVSAGTNQFSLDSLWQRAARRVLPPRYAVRIPQPIVASCGWTNSITVWLQLRDPVYRTNLHQDWGWLETVSDFGDVWRADGGSGCTL